MKRNLFKSYQGIGIPLYLVCFAMLLQSGFGVSTLVAQTVRDLPAVGEPPGSSAGVLGKIASLPPLIDEATAVNPETGVKKDSPRRKSPPEKNENGYSSALQSAIQDAVKRHQATPPAPGTVTRQSRQSPSSSSETLRPAAARVNNAKRQVTARPDSKPDLTKSPPKIPGAFQRQIQPERSDVRAAQTPSRPKIPRVQKRVPPMQVARMTRHPLAMQQDPVPQIERGSAPDYQPGQPKSVVESWPAGQHPSAGHFPQGPGVHYSADPDLLQAPIADNQLRPQHTLPPEQLNRERFWKQFATLPPDDPKARTEGYDSLQAVLNNGFWFAGVDVMYLEPMFQENNAFSTSSGSSNSAERVDFGFDVSFRGYFGFETNAGPAVKFSFLRLNEMSSLKQFSYTATDSATTFIDMGDSDNQILFGQGASPGSRLTQRQQLKIYSPEILVYKDQKNPVSRVRGNVGLRMVSLQQKLFAGLDDPLAGSSVVRNFNDYAGLGPKLGIEYFRPLGHTDLELQSGFFGSLLFGRRDQILDLAGPTPASFRQIGKVEPLTIFEMYLGVQWNIQVSKCQRVYLRSAIESQLWAGSDSALDIGSDLGLYGMTFGFGMTR